MKLEQLSSDQAAKHLAYAIVQVGISDETQIRSDLARWSDTKPEIGFGEYLVENSLLGNAELGALSKVVSASLSRNSESIQANIDTWFKFDNETVDQVDQSTSSTPTRAQKQSQTSALQQNHKSRGVAKDSHGPERFRVISQHRQGGLGEVFVAEDTQFHRQVALKRIKSQYVNKADLCSRFVVEAELTGGLEHPGIVPVYGLGTAEDGSPFYAMKFVQGESMADALERFHHRQEKSFRSLEFRKLLQRFVAVCYTIHFSHTRGVLHRDIKPDNIMLGEFDETLVVDWGIAKVIGTSKTKPEDDATLETLYPASDIKSKGTQVGRVIGTPGYMSGEQALGWHDSLGPDSDVFSLGATLYSILVSARPFDALTNNDILKNTIAGDLVPPREIDARVPKPLQAICQKAADKSRANRYKSAQMLARDIESWLADEPVQAWQEPYLIRARRWVGKHKTSVTSAVAALLVLAVAAVIASVMMASANKRESAARERATGNFMMAKNVVDDFLGDLASDPRFENAGVEDLMGEMLTKAETYYQQLEGQSLEGKQFSTERAETAFRLSNVARRLGQPDKADRYLVEAKHLLKSNGDDSQDHETNLLLLGMHTDHAGILTETGQLDAAEKVVTEALDLANRGIAQVAEDDPRYLVKKIWLLVRRRTIFENKKQFEAMLASRQEYWATVKAFLEIQQNAEMADQLQILDNAMSIVPLSDQEASETQQLRLELMERSVGLMKNASGETLVVQLLQARNAVALADAYNASGDWKRTWEYGQQAADLWLDLVRRQPKSVTNKQSHINSLYKAFYGRINQEAVAVNVAKEPIERLPAAQVVKIYEQATESIEPIMQQDTVNIDAEMVYVHLISGIAGYLHQAQQSSELVLEITERSLELLKRLPESGHSKVTFIRNAVKKSSAEIYLDLGRTETGIKIYDELVDELSQQIENQNDDFATWSQRLDTRVQYALQLFENKQRQKSTSQVKLALSEIQSVPEDVQVLRQQLMLGMLTRVSSLLIALHSGPDQKTEREEYFDLGTRELLERGVKIDNPKATSFVLEFGVNCVRYKIGESDFQGARDLISYLLEHVEMPRKHQVKFLADRAKCYANLGSIDLATEDFRKGNVQANGLADDILLDLMIAALTIAEAQDNESGDPDNAVNMDSYATTLLLQLFNKGLFEYELARVMLRDEKTLDRLRDVPDLEVFFDQLPKTGKAPFPKQAP